MFLITLQVYLNEKWSDSTSKNNCKSKAMLKALVKLDKITYSYTFGYEK